MPSSVRSNLRARRLEAAAKAAAQQSFGLEDELSFGSDEDLMETIGEIELPDTTTPELSPALSGDNVRVMQSGAVQGGTSVRVKTKKSSLTSSSSSSSKNKEIRVRYKDSKDSSSSSSLASSTHLLPPLPPVPSGSTLDLPTDMFGDRSSPSSSHKRGSLMGAFKVKGLRKWRDDQSSRTSFVTDTASQASTLSLAKITSNSSRPSFSSSVVYPTSAAASPSSNVPHLGPLSLPSLDSQSDGGASLRKQSRSDSFDVKPVAIINGALHSSPTPSSVATFISPKPSQSHWASNGIAAAILPGFPATVGSLEPITVFSASAAKRPPSSILSSGGERGPNGFRAPSTSSRWTPCTLVFTQFKISLAPEEAAQHGGDNERTVAHIHVFSTKQQQLVNGSMGIRRSKSSAGINPDQVAPRVEVERRTLSHESSATVCEDCTDVDGRSVVLRILFGHEDRTKAGNEWLLEMKDESQLYEWIRQIKKTAIMINAEELGYGHAVRSAYENSNVSADELAHKLSVHARAVAEARDRQGPAAALTARTSGPASAISQSDERRASLDLAQGVALNRSHSADDANTRNGAPAIPRAHPFETSSNRGQNGTAVRTGYTNGNGQSLYSGDLSTSPGLNLNGLTLESGFSFPAPPSALPPPRRPPPVPRAEPASNTTTPMSSASPTVPNVASLDSPSVSSVSTMGKRSPSLRPAPAAPSHAAVPSGNANSGDADDEDDDEEEEEHLIVRPPTPPRGASKDDTSRNHPPVTQAVNLLGSRAVASSITSTNTSSTSGTSRLRRLRGKPQVIDIMSEFSAIEAENMPPDEDEEPIREDRERRIRFAGDE